MPLRFLGLYSRPSWEHQKLVLISVVAHPRRQVSASLVQKHGVQTERSYRNPLLFLFELHPSLSGRRQVSAALLQKHGVQPSKQSAAELAAELSEGGSDVESSGSEESGSDEEAGSSEDEGSDSDADADADADADEAAGTTAAGAGSTRSRKQAVGSVPDATAEVAGADAAATALEARRQSGGDASTAAEQPQPKRQVSKCRAVQATI